MPMCPRYQQMYSNENSKKAADYYESGNTYSHVVCFLFDTNEV